MPVDERTTPLGLPTFSVGEDWRYVPKRAPGAAMTMTVIRADKDGAVLKIHGGPVVRTQAMSLVAGDWECVAPKGHEAK